MNKGQEERWANAQNRRSENNNKICLSKEEKTFIADSRWWKYLEMSRRFKLEMLKGL